MSLLQTLNKDLIQAMKAKDHETLKTVRMLKSSVTNEQIKLGHDLTPAEELSVLSTEMKQRKESLAEFQKAGRDDLVAETLGEIDVVQQYMPKQLSETEVSDLVDQTISEVGATSKADFGKVMKVLMPKVKGQADGNLVKHLVQTKLA